MTPGIDRTLPHHPALGLVVYTRPRRTRTLDDRTDEQIRASRAAPGHGPNHRHRRRG